MLAYNEQDLGHDNTHDLGHTEEQCKEKRGREREERYGDPAVSGKGSARYLRRALTGERKTIMSGHHDSVSFLKHQPPVSNIIYTSCQCPIGSVSTRLGVLGEVTPWTRGSQPS